MKNYILSLALICLLSFVQQNLFAQGFNSVTTPDGTNIVAVGNTGNLYRSANGGVTWTGGVNGALHQNSVVSLGNDVWIAANSGTVYKTLKTTSSVSTYNIGASLDLYSVFFTDANTGYVCGVSGTVYKSVNGGVNWSSSNSGIPAVKLNSISFRDGSNGTVVGDGGAVYVTNNAGASWSSQSSGTTNNLLKVKYFNDSLTAVGEYGTLLLNKNGSWTSVSTRIRNDIRGVAGTSMNDVHVAGGGGFIRNNKSGSTGFLNFENNPMMANITDIFYYGANNGWAVSSLNNVIIYTSNGGSSWSMPTGATVAYTWVSKPGASGNFLGNNLAHHPVKRNTLYCAFSNQVYRSMDRGETWSTVGSTMAASSTPHSLFVSPLDTNIWLVATESSPFDKIYRTSNYGVTWDTVMNRNFSNYGQPLEIDQNNPSVFYFTPDGGGFYKSVNSGATFTEISGNFPFRSPCEILVTWDSSNVIIVGDGTTGSGRGVIFRSVNGGVNWTSIDTVSTDGSETPSMCNSVLSKNLIWCTEWGGSDVYRSTDSGNDFTLHHSSGFSGWGSDICREDPSLVIIGSWGAAGALSLNAGSNWTNISTGLSGHGGGIYIPERGLVIAQQGSNIYKLNIVYTYTPLIAAIDVQPTSLGSTGVQYYPTATIFPTGTVINNNGAASATFTVTRKITPGGYSSTKTVTNLAASTSTQVTFDAWTFSSGTMYTVKDSVSISGDTNPGNDVISGTITPNVGLILNRLNEVFSGSFPPAGWTFQFTGTNYWITSVNSAYNVGTGCAEYNYYDAQSNTGSKYLVSPNFSASIAGDSLKYDWAYAPYDATSRDSLIIEFSTNGGSSYDTLVRLYGYVGATGNRSLNTRAVLTSEYQTPAVNEWQSKKWSLPVNTNKVRFRARSGFGNNLFLDNVMVSTGSAYTQFNVKLAPEGLFNGSTLSISDTVRAYLRSTVSPFNKIDSATEVINQSTLIAPFVFKNAASGTYYIQIIHRNALETWSKAGGEALTKGVTGSFDFTSLQNQTYGNNSVLVGSVWCLYSGDIGRDGAIDISDVVDIYNDLVNFESGYRTTDLNGDETIDVSDLLIAYNNSNNFVGKVTPETAPSNVQANKELMKQKMTEYKLGRSVSK